MKAHYLLRQLTWLTPDERRTARYVARHAQRCLTNTATAPSSPLSACAILALAGGVVLHQRAQARLANALQHPNDDLAPHCAAHAATQAALLEAQSHLERCLSPTPTTHEAPSTPAWNPTTMAHAAAALPAEDPAARHGHHAATEVDTEVEAALPPAAPAAPAASTRAPITNTEPPAPPIDVANTPANNPPRPAQKSNAPTPEFIARQKELTAHFRKITGQRNQHPASPATTPHPTEGPAPTGTPCGSLSGLPLPSDRAKEVQQTY